MPRITFVDADGAEYPVNADIGLTIMEAARDNDIPGIEAECGGAGACATCHIYIDRQWYAVSGEADRVEQELLDLVQERRDESRLSCQVKISDEMEGLIVRLPEEQGF